MNTRTLVLSICSILLTNFTTNTTCTGASGPEGIMSGENQRPEIRELHQEQELNQERELHQEQELNHERELNQEQELNQERELHQDNDKLFRIGLEFYSEAMFDSAAIYFDRVNTPEARLFSGKSYFSVSEYPLAKKHLRAVTRDDPRIFDEARYTLALAFIQTRQFGKSADLLFELKSRPAYQNLNRDAEQVYNRIMGYLTTEQRRNAFVQSELPAVHLDLLRSGLPNMVRSEAEALYNALLPYLEVSTDSGILEAIHRRIQGLPEELASSPSYGPPPEGMVYNIGVLLPETRTGSGEWQVSRSLYNGYLLAAEKFNREHPDRHIRLHHIQTSDTSTTLEAAMTRLAWTQHVDAVLGPLFSENAYRIGKLAEYYEIPVIPPLANSDTLNIDNPYLYQINPTFEVRGRAMANFAVNELGLDTLAVITQSNQPVSREAREFRNEAERLGAVVLHYFSENFEARAFEVDHITPIFAGDVRFLEEYDDWVSERERLIEEGYPGVEEDYEELELTPVKGLYISVTGAGAEHLIELILNDLQAFRSTVTILGNEEIAHADLTPSARSYFDIYYSNFMYRDTDRRQTYNFRNDYRSMTGSDPDDFAHLGYDTGTFIYKTIHELQNPSRLKHQMRHRPPFEGVITNIDFRNTHINHNLFFFRIERDDTIRVKPGEYADIDDDEGDDEENDNNAGTGNADR